MPSSLLHLLLEKILQGSSTAEESSENETSWAKQTWNIIIRVWWHFRLWQQSIGPCVVHWQNVSSRNEKNYQTNAN